MKMTKIAMLVVTIAVVLFVLVPSLSWAAEDGAALYKAKCAACHGADAAGKPQLPFVLRAGHPIASVRSRDASGREHFLPARTAFFAGQRF